MKTPFGTKRAVCAISMVAAVVIALTPFLYSGDATRAASARRVVVTVFLDRHCDGILNPLFDRTIPAVPVTLANAADGERGGTTNALGVAVFSNVTPTVTSHLSVAIPRLVADEEVGLCPGSPSSVELAPQDHVLRPDYVRVRVAPSATLADGLGVAWGPEQFTRDARWPRSETRPIALADFQPPFILHLANGDPDGGQRVSSGMVWLDGRLVFGPSHFGQQTSRLSVEVHSDGSSQLTVWLAGRPGTHASLWIEGRPPTVTIGPEGGVFEFPAAGVTLTVPSGAVPENTPVGVSALELSAAQAVVDAQDAPFRTRVKRVLGGFVGTPDGLTFAKPVVAEFSMLPPDPGERVVGLDLDLAGRSYTTLLGSIHYEAEPPRGRLELLHFSAPAVAGSSRECRAADISCEQERKCRDCSTWDPAVCAMLDPDQTPCCTIKRASRPTCGQESCFCCKELAQETTVSEMDTAVQYPDPAAPGECRLTGRSQTTSFPYCDQHFPTEDREFSLSEGCPSDLKYALVIDPPPPIRICEERTLDVRLEAATPNGRYFTVTDPQLFSATVADPMIASAPLSQGPVVQGERQGQTTVRVDASWDERRLTPGSVALQVSGCEADCCTVEITRPGDIGVLWVPVGGEITLAATAVHGTEPVPRPFSWRSEPLGSSGSAQLTPQEQGETARLLGLAPGLVQVTASDSENPALAGSVTVEVGYIFTGAFGGFSGQLKAGQCTWRADYGGSATISGGSTSAKASFFGVFHYFDPAVDANPDDDERCGTNLDPQGAPVADMPLVVNGTAVSGSGGLSLGPYNVTYHLSGTIGVTTLSGNASFTIRTTDHYAEMTASGSFSLPLLIPEN